MVSTKSRWRGLLPVLWGIALTAIVGMLACRQELCEQRVLLFGYYSSALMAIMQAMDRSAFFGLAFTLCLAPWYWGSRLPGRMKTVVRLLLPASAAALLVILYWRALGPLTAAIMSTARVPLRIPFRAIGPFFLTPAGLCLIAASLAIILAVTLRRRTRQVNMTMLPVVFRLLRSAATVLFSVLSRVILALSVLVFLAVHLAAGAFQARNAVALRDQPNVIFIMVDTLRADHVGCYGYDLPVTPHIDGFARKSTRFTHAVAQSAWTPWSVHSLMTSRYPDIIFPFGRERSDQVFLHPYFPTLAETLNNQGYATGAITSSPFLTRRYDAQQGYAYFDDTLAADNTLWTGTTSQSVTDRAIRLLAKLTPRKFFLYVVFFDPHNPYLQHPGFKFKESKRMDREEAQRLAAITRPDQMVERRVNHAAYNSEIGYTDDQVGRFLDELKRRRVYDDALIVLFADHGDAFLDHGRFYHQHTLYEELTHVPLIIKFPRQQQGRVVGGTFPLLDLYPSLLKYLHVEQTTLGLQGTAVDLPALLRCADKPAFATTIFETDRVNSVISGRYKLIRTQSSQEVRNDRLSDSTLELYDLAADPAERHNLQALQPDVVRSMKTLFDRRDEHQAESDRRFVKERLTQKMLPQQKASTLDPASLEKMRALGYLN